MGSGRDPMPQLEKEGGAAVSVSSSPETSGGGGGHSPLSPPLIPVRLPSPPSLSTQLPQPGSSPDKNCTQQEATASTRKGYGALMFDELH